MTEARPNPGHKYAPSIYVSWNQRNTSPCGQHGTRRQRGPRPSRSRERGPVVAHGRLSAPSWTRSRLRRSCRERPCDSARLPATQRLLYMRRMWHLDVSLRVPLSPPFQEKPSGTPRDFGGRCEVFFCSLSCQPASQANRKSSTHRLIALVLPMATPQEETSDSEDEEARGLRGSAPARNIPRANSGPFFVNAKTLAQACHIEYLKAENQPQLFVRGKRQESRDLVRRESLSFSVSRCAGSPSAGLVQPIHQGQLPDAPPGHFRVPFL